MQHEGARTASPRSSTCAQQRAAGPRARRPGARLGSHGHGLWPGERAAASGTHARWWARRGSALGRACSRPHHDPLRQPTRRRTTPRRPPAARPAPTVAPQRTRPMTPCQRRSSRPPHERGALHPATAAPQWALVERRTTPTPRGGSCRTVAAAAPAAAAAAARASTTQMTSGISTCRTLCGLAYCARVPSHVLPGPVNAVVAGS